MLFVVAAAMLVALAAVLVVNLAGAIDTLMTQAKTPHFTQMHAGDLDLARLTAFAEQNESCRRFPGAGISQRGRRAVFIFWVCRPFAGGQCAGQWLRGAKRKFDFLLDLDGNIIQVYDGEIYVPITYMQDGIARVGETLP
jgi:putative ABC transport system permease protein